MYEAHRRGRVRLAPGVKQRIRAQWALEALQAGQLRRELAIVEPVVRDACGIRPVLVKGPAVAERLYPDRALRPFRDLDLVVPADRLEPAARALRIELGYEPEEEPWAGFGESVGHHVSMVRRVGEGGVCVDLHWRLSDDPVAERLTHAWLLASAGRLPLAGGGEVAVPGAEDELVVLNLHLLHEQQKRLAWVHDVALAAGRASEAEWRGAFVAARDLELSWVLDRGLEYAAHHLGLRRRRPWGPGRPPPFGPLRIGERLDGWLGTQLGHLALGGWRERDGYLRSAARARRTDLRRRLGALRPTR
jgi:hypothetical protein